MEQRDVVERANRGKRETGKSHKDDGGANKMRDSEEILNKLDRVIAKMKEDEEKLREIARRMEKC